MNMSDKETILSIKNWPNNGSLISDCHRLGYIGDLDSVLDCTYGHGVFWSVWKPKGYLFHRCDANPAKSPDSPDGVDFRKMEFNDKSFDVVVFDPPYKLNGKPDPDVDERYGVDESARWQDRWDLIYEGLTECCRVARHRVLCKVQAQVCAGKVRWQDVEAINVAAASGFGLRDRFNFLSHREQPEGRVQRTARQNASQLLVLERDWKWRP